MHDFGTHVSGNIRKNSTAMKCIPSNSSPSADWITPQIWSTLAVEVWSSRNGAIQEHKTFASFARRTTKCEFNLAAKGGASGCGTWSISTLECFQGLGTNLERDGATQLATRLGRECKFAARFKVLCLQQGWTCHHRLRHASGPPEPSFDARRCRLTLY